MALAKREPTHWGEVATELALGVTVASVDPQVRAAFHKFGELLAERFKLGALLVFGALISPALLRDVSLGGYAFALLILLAVRPLALFVALPPRRVARRGNLARRGWLAAWFGPKGLLR